MCSYGGARPVSFSSKLPLSLPKPEGYTVPKGRYPTLNFGSRNFDLDEKWLTPNIHKSMLLLGSVSLSLSVHRYRLVRGKRQG